MRLNSVTRQVNFNQTKNGGKCQNWKNSNETFWVVFTQCGILLTCIETHIALQKLTTTNVTQVSHCCRLKLMSGMMINYPNEVFFFFWLNNFGSLHFVLQVWKLALIDPLQVRMSKQHQIHIQSKLHIVYDTCAQLVMW